MLDTTTPATNNASGGSPHQTAVGAAHRAEMHGLLLDRTFQLNVLSNWLDNASRDGSEEMFQVRIAVRRTSWGYMKDARVALQQLGGLAAAW